MRQTEDKRPVLLQTFASVQVTFFLRKITFQFLKCVSRFCFRTKLISKTEHRHQRRNSFLLKHFNLHASIFCDTIFVPHDSSVPFSLSAQTCFFKSREIPGHNARTELTDSYRHTQEDISN
jgi:hypothetical protein